jgi:hypothetical protein
LRKKPYRLPCALLVPDLVTMLMEAPVAEPSSRRKLRLLWLPWRPGLGQAFSAVA